MGTFSTGLKSVASSLLTTYGQSVTFTRYSTTEYNVVTGSVEPLQATTFSGVGHPSVYAADEIDGETIQRGDIRLMLYSVTEPLIEDEASVDSVDYRVMSIEKLQAQGEAIVYRLQLRK